MNTSLIPFMKKNEHKHDRGSIVSKGCHSIEMNTLYSNSLESRGIIFRGDSCTHINPQNPCFSVIHNNLYVRQT